MSTNKQDSDSYPSEIKELWDYVGQQASRLSALSYALGVVEEPLLTQSEINKLCKKFGFSVIESLATSCCVEDLVYDLVLDRQWITSSVVMSECGVTRANSINIMRRVAAAHADLVLSKKRIRPTSNRTQWVLEMKTWTVKGVASL